MNVSSGSWFKEAVFTLHVEALCKGFMYLMCQVFVSVGRQSPWHVIIC